MVTTGSEGAPPGESLSFIDTHDRPDIDYVTIHIWPQNWGWYDPKNRPSRTRPAEKWPLAYFRNRAVEAITLGKPIVLEEFGLARERAGAGHLQPQLPHHDGPVLPGDVRRGVPVGSISGGPVAGRQLLGMGGGGATGDAWIGDPPHETGRLVLGLRPGRFHPGASSEPTRRRSPG